MLTFKCSYGSREVVNSTRSFESGRYDVDGGNKIVSKGVVQVPLSTEPISRRTSTGVYSVSILAARIRLGLC